MSADVLVTGVGMVTPAGATTQATWAALLDGARAVDRLGPAETDGSPKWLGARAASIPSDQGVGGLSRASRFAVEAAEQGLAMARLEPGRLEHDRRRRMAVILGTSKPCIESNTLLNLLRPLGVVSALNNLARHNRAHSLDGYIPLYDGLADAPARAVGAQLGVPVGLSVPVAACATGTVAVMRGAQLIRDGRADLVLAGSTDAPLHPLWLAAYERMALLAPEHDTLGPAWACRPFDRSRCGFAVGEGAAVLVLEPAAEVRGRGAEPLARIIGWAEGSDPAGLTGLEPGGQPLAHVIELACGRAGCSPQEIMCIHAHGTATPSNDRVEMRAIRQALGPAAARVPVVSAKGAIGHLMGAAGAVESALAVLSCRHRCSFGTTTLLEPDPDLGPLTLATARFEHPAGPVLKLSLGFGGHLAVLVVAPA